MPPHLKDSKVFIPALHIQGFVDKIAARIEASGVKFDIMVPLMSGAALFATDLLKALMARDIDMAFHPVKVTRHRGRIYVEDRFAFASHIESKSVLFVDCIYDSGQTAEYVNDFAKLSAANVGWAFLMVSNAERLGGMSSVFYGIEYGKSGDFYYGYGLDLNGMARGLPHIFAAPSSSIPQALLDP